MTLFCRSCGLTDFRTSRIRFRLSDLARLLILRLPVRCRNCHERAFSSLRQYLKLRNAGRARHRKHISTM